MAEGERDRLVLEELRRREHEIMGKMLSTEVAKTLAKLKQDLQIVKAQIAEQQE